ncbi:hypothetical protein F2Q68_00027511 [Brassica cretica]|uniref:Uncharacterized protein n=1 Tax=Brassica cretica TaxID=69181 RepID=A0A8S9IA83_BRACR|nr:hypothetical protein F2Q68_00027511 [Brassica cretica]
MKRASWTSDETAGRCENEARSAGRSSDKLSVAHIKFGQLRTDCPETLPEPVKIRMTEANENAKLSEFQQELVQLAAVLKGDDVLTTYPKEIGKGMTVIQGKMYMEDAVKRFLEAGRLALDMGANKEELVHMKPSLTGRRH